MESENLSAEQESNVPIIERAPPIVENLKVDPGDGELVPDKEIIQRVPSQNYVEDLEEDGPDPQELDLADLDKPIRGQKFSCISYVEPQFETLEKREAYTATHFLQAFLKSYTRKVVSTMAQDYNIDVNEALIKYDLNEKIEDDAENFKDENWKKTKAKHENRVDNHFFKADVYDMLVKYHRYKDYNVVEIKKALKEEYPDECFDRALKVRGVFSTYTKARKFAAELFKKDKTVNIFVIQTGAWVPFNPPQELIDKQVTIDKQLNKLLWGYNKNKIYAEHFYNERREEMIKDRARRKTTLDRDQTPRIINDSSSENGDVKEMFVKPEIDRRKVRNKRRRRRRPGNK